MHRNLFYLVICLASLAKLKDTEAVSQNTVVSLKDIYKNSTSIDSLYMPVADRVKIEDTFNYYANLIANIKPSLVGANLTINGGSVTLPTMSIGTTTIKDTTITSSVTAKPYYRYYTNSSSLITITLPASFSITTPIQVIGVGTGGWKIAQNADQTIHSTSANTTTGTSGYLQSQNQYACVSLRAISTTDFVIDNLNGTPLFN